MIVKKSPSDTRDHPFTEDDTFRILQKKTVFEVNDLLIEFTNTPEYRVGFYELHANICRVIQNAGWDVDEYENAEHALNLRGFLFRS